MDIKYLGHSSFFIRSKDAKIVTDPFDPSAVGLKYSKQEADFATISHAHPDHAFREGVKGTPVFFDWPGDFEKNKARVTGIRTFHDTVEGKERGENLMFKIEVDGISILHCGDLGHLLSDSLIEKVGEVDILLIPVGGMSTIGPLEAAKIIKEIDPSIVIPMHYFVSGMNETTYKELKPLSEFLKIMGAEDVVPIEKLSLKKEDLVAEEVKVVLLQSA